MTDCPSCGEPAERGQLVCLECGGRIALEQQRREPRRPESAAAIALLLSVVVIGAGALGFVLGTLTDDSDGKVAAADRREPPPAPAAGNGAPQTETETGAAQEPRQSPLLEWPADLRAYTVVLVTTGDRPAARRVALEAAGTGIEAGVLRSDEHDLGEGLWIVFAGRFDTQAAAERQAVELGERYPGAYATLVAAAS